VSRATATVTLIRWLFPPDEGLQLVHLHRAVAFRVGGRMVGGIGRHTGRVRRHPVGDRLMDDAEQSRDGAQTHPFEIEPHRLLMDRSAMPLLFRGRGKVVLAGEAAAALRPGAVTSPTM